VLVIWKAVVGPAAEYLLAEPSGQVYGVLARRDVDHAFAGVQDRPGTVSHLDIIGGPDGNVVRSQGGTPTSSCARCWLI